MIGREDESLKFYQKWYKRIIESGERSIYSTFRMALSYYENGKYDEARYFFDEQITAYQKVQNLGRLQHELLYTFLDMAAIHAFRGEKEMALENLRKFKEKQSMPVFVITLLTQEQYFDSLNNDPEFMNIYNEINAKYQAEHERVRKWLEEQGML